MAAATWAQAVHNFPGFRLECFSFYRVLITEVGECKREKRALKKKQTTDVKLEEGERRRERQQGERRNRSMCFADNDSAQRAVDTTPEWDLSPDTAAWHWLKVTMEIRPVGGCVCVCVHVNVSYRHCRVLIYAPQGAAVKSDVWFARANCLGLCLPWRQAL